MEGTISLVDDLRTAVTRGLLDVAYQLQWELHESPEGFARVQPAAVEALCRWSHPELGQIPPTSFIPLAENAGFLDELDLLVLRRAAVQVAEWRTDGLHVGLSVNASPTRFDEAYARMLLDELSRTGLDPSSVTVEVTETPVPQLRPEMRAGIDLLRAHGVAISVDDFDGVAMRVEMLDSLPIDEVKIDRTLTQREDDDAAAIIRDVVDLARERGWRVVAEGIETAEELDRALERRFDRAQGFLWGRPASAARLSELLARS